ncbi:helix-turn-helix domain-containing protein [Paenibacillus sp. FSL K6-1230]|uniref:helix-turn-helix domain-containing protein n=1 Tax=Paenibacillus sp. FSL K6-1230 TaxID=2921603 RepID=UPI004046EDCF
MSDTARFWLDYSYRPHHEILHLTVGHIDNRVVNTLGLYITKETRLFPNEPPEELNTSGARIRYHRILRSLTIVELAAKAGISVVALSRIERNVNPAKIHTLQTLSKILGQPVSYLGCYDGMLENTLGEKIKKARHYHGLTKRELSARIKVDAKTIHNWELGKTKPSTKYLDKVQTVIEILKEYDTV